jgi:diketogulonate reductase-like aldo/keto reductase
MRMATDRIARHRFGPTGRILGVIGQGTWYLETGNRASSIAALRAGIDLGMTMIDTAEMYGAGAAERLIGEAIAGRRDEIFLVSKVLPEHASRRGTIVACERSLMRLKIDRLDSYLLHWRGQYPLAETIAAFEQLRADGKIRSWGVSNFDVPDLEEAWAIAGQGRIACNRVLQAIAAAHHATPRQVALRFLVRRPSLFTIPKAASVEHAGENAGAGSLQLTNGELARISDAFPVGPPSKELPVI